MIQLDEVAIANERHWQTMVKEGCGYTIPWLNLDVDRLREYATGSLDGRDEPFFVIQPPSVLSDVEGKDVLCVAAGGGQQSAVFGLLGAHVTVVDLAEGQLEGDKQAAAHYGYRLSTIHGDMRDLSFLDDHSFDLVYGTGMCYVPIVRDVFLSIARILRIGGIYTSDFGQPAVHFVAWDGEAYRITQPYSQKTNYRPDGAIEFRHYMSDIFNGIIGAGFSIREVHEQPQYLHLGSDVPPGSWTHEEAYVAGKFVIVACKDNAF